MQVTSGELNTMMLAKTVVCRIGLRKSLLENKCTDYCRLSIWGEKKCDVQSILGGFQLRNYISGTKTDYLCMNNDGEIKGPLVTFSIHGAMHGEIAWSNDL